MNNKKQKFRTIAPTLGLVLIAAMQILTIVHEKNTDESSTTSSSYVVKEDAKKLKPESWDSVYLPSELPYSYSLSMATSSDTYLSCRFSQDSEILALRYPAIYFTQWNSIRETIPAENSKLPPILKTGKVYSGGYVDDTAEQLEVNIDTTLEAKTYNGKKYYYCDGTPNGDLLLLWYNEQNTFALRVKPETAIKAKANFALDDMLEIADSVENYS
ncbi:hypothetical protein DSECCO2_188300 [anaerobic digester metagenome]